MKFSIVELRKEYDSGIEKVIRGCLIEYGANHEGTAWADPFLGRLSEVYTEAETVYYVALAGGEVVAGAGIGKVEGSADTCELQKMYCRKEFRGKGIAQALLDQALAFAGKHYRYCYLETLDNMIEAQAFYRRNGFRRIDHALGDTEHVACDVRFLKDLR